MNLRDNDRLDQWLDSALSEYGEAEPRAGLEKRVMANLALRTTDANGPRRWWALATSAAVVGVAMLLWLGELHHRKFAANVIGSEHSGREKRGAGNAASEVKQAAAEPSKYRRIRQRSVNALRSAEIPKVSQFPSPRPLSEQEKLLVRYVNESPSDAVLIAKEQAARLREIQEHESNSPAGTLGINQQER